MDTFSLQLTTPDGETYQLNSPPTKAVYDMTGWGMSDKEVASVRTPFQQGETVLSQKLNVRTVTFSFYHTACTFASRMGNQTLLVDVLRENRSPLGAPEPSRLTLFYFDGTQYIKRALNVFFTGGTSFPLANSDTWAEWDIREDLEFTAYDPLVYDPVQVTYAVDTFSNNLTLATTYPIVFNTYKATGTITNSGTWESFPVIDIVGPAKNVSILNTSTGKRINLKAQVGSGDIVRLDLSEGVKTVILVCDSADWIRYVTGDLGTFSLQVRPLVEDGINNMQVYSELYDPGVTTVNFKYYKRYRAL